MNNHLVRSNRLVLWVWFLVLMISLIGVACDDTNGGSSNEMNGGEDPSNSMDAGRNTEDQDVPPVNRDEEFVESLEPASVGSGETFSVPFDAVPTPDGSGVYFTGSGVNGPAVFRAGESGGAPTVVAEGLPLVAPFGVELSMDGETLYIGDPAGKIEGSEEEGAQGNTGGIFSLSTQGGAVTVVSGTEGYKPSGVVLVDQDGTERIFFTAISTNSGLVGVYSVDATGGNVNTIAEGEPFFALGGIAVHSNGDVYVLDTAGVVYRIPEGGTPMVSLDGFRTGFPAGLALTLDESWLLISARDSASLNDLLIRLNVNDGSTEETNTGISEFSEPAGLGRAHNADVFAWSDLTAGSNGTVYVVRLKN